MRSRAPKWREACTLRLDYRLEQLWLLIEPTVIIEWIDGISEEERNVAKEFIRSRLARRYNREANAMLDGWVRVLLGSGRDPVRFLGVDGHGGIGAEFEIMPVSGFSGVGQ